jgi:hypothetical protein
MAAVTYMWPATGAVAPTALQSKERVVASISTVTAAGDIQVVHNMGLTAAQLAAGAPIVNVEPVVAEFNTGPRLIVSAQTANGTTLTQLSGSNTATVAVVTVRRPHTIGQ